MSLKEKVLDILEEACKMDKVRENLDIELFKGGLIDLFGAVNLLLMGQERLGIAVGVSKFEREKWSTTNRIISLLENRE